jgi:hypothetical protein
MSVTVSSFFMNLVEHYLLLVSTYQMVDFVASFSLVLLVIGTSHEMHLQPNPDTLTRIEIKEGNLDLRCMD